MLRALDRTSSCTWRGAGFDAWLYGILRNVVLGLYEVWFVGPDDRPRSPNRISAGTFHPDEHCRSHVDLTAAVDPELYPELSVPAEPGES